MKILTGLFAILLLSGCDRILSNDEVIHTTQYCSKNGLDTIVFYGSDGSTPGVIKAQCVPARKKKQCL